MFDTRRPALRLLAGGLEETTIQWSWFCGHCASPSLGGGAPPPGARVCPSCGLGLLLEAREDAIPGPHEPFLVIDSALLVQAMSREAQSLLGMSEEAAVNRPVAELLVPADVETEGSAGFAAVIARAAEGDYDESVHKFVRPWNTFGVRMRSRICTCGPPRAALIVLEPGAKPRPLRAVASMKALKSARSGR